MSSKPKPSAGEIWRAYENTDDYKRFKTDPKEEYKRKKIINIQYSLIDFMGTSYLRPSEMSKFHLYEAVRPYAREILKHNHSQALLGFNPRLKDGTQYVCMMCLHCHQIYGVPFNVTTAQRPDFDLYMQEIFKAYDVFMDWREMRRDFRKNKFDYHGVVKKLAGMFDPED